jgi:hypothetical protein
MELPLAVIVPDRLLASIFDRQPSQSIDIVRCEIRSFINTLPLFAHKTNDVFGHFYGVT